MIMKLKKAQIIGYRPKATRSFLAALIKLGGKIRFSHIMLYDGQGYVLEAGWPKSGKRLFSEEYLNEEDFMVVDVKGITNKQRDDIINYALEGLDVRYDWWHYPILFIYTWFGRYDWAKKLIKFAKGIDDTSGVNCSEFISRHIFAGTGIDLCESEPHDFTLPDHLMYSDKVERVYP